MGNIDIWAEYGGLLGLVIFGKFMLICIFLGVLNRKDREHRHFLQSLLDDHTHERRHTTEKHDKQYERLSDALDRLTDVMQRNT